MHQLNKLIIICSIGILACSCASIAPYERGYLNDSDMQMSARGGKNFENYAHTIREGSSIARSSKASGGCGCY